MGASHLGPTAVHLSAQSPAPAPGGNSWLTEDSLRGPETTPQAADTRAPGQAWTSQRSPCSCGTGLSNVRNVAFLAAWLLVTALAVRVDGVSGRHGPRVWRPPANPPTADVPGSTAPPRRARRAGGPHVAEPSPPRRLPTARLPGRAHVVAHALGTRGLFLAQAVVSAAA